MILPRRKRCAMLFLTCRSRAIRVQNPLTVSPFMRAIWKGQNSLGATAGCDLYEVRPRKSGDGFDLISELFRYGPIWFAGPDAVRNAVAYAKVPFSLALAPGKDPRVGRLRRCNPDALILFGDGTPPHGDRCTKPSIGGRR